MKKQKNTKNRAKRHTELKKQIEEQHPGIKEVMEVYGQWAKAHKTIQAHEAIKRSRYTPFNSNSSDPFFYFQER